MRRLAALATLFAVSSLAILHSAPQAYACSCAGINDVRAGVDQAPAAFVGTLAEKRSAGNGQFGGEAIYVFDVEQWVKGDLGPLVEVRSADNGAACGLEFWNDDNRVGLLLYEEAGEIRSGLCSQVDPDVLLASMEPVVFHPELAPALVVGGWGTGSLFLLSADGRLVSVLEPETPQEWVGTAALDLCPGGKLMVQVTGQEALIWDLVTFSTIDSIALEGGNDGVQPYAVSCRDKAASEVWGAYHDQLTGESTRLLDLTNGGEVLFELDGNGVSFGTGHIVTSGFDDAPVERIDTRTGTKVTLREVATPGPDNTVSLMATAHPTDERTAVVEVKYGEGVGTRIFIYDAAGKVIAEADLAGESYGAPVWVDHGSVAVAVADDEGWEHRSLIIVNADDGTFEQVRDWQGDWYVGSQGTIYGLAGAHVYTVDESLSPIELTVLGGQDNSMLVMLPADTPAPGTPPVPTQSTQPTAPPITAPPPGTVPPLVDPEAIEAPTPASDQTIAQIGLSAVALAGAGVYLINRRRTALRKGNEIE